MRDFLRTISCVLLNGTMCNRVSKYSPPEQEKHRTKVNIGKRRTLLIVCAPSFCHLNFGLRIYSRKVSVLLSGCFLSSFQFCSFPAPVSDPFSPASPSSLSSLFCCAQRLKGLGFKFFPLMSVCMKHSDC